MNFYKQVKKIKNKKEQDYEKIADRLSKLDRKHQEMVFILISVHYKNNNDKVHKLRDRALPYKGSTLNVKNGAKYNKNDFPDDLKKIICNFIYLAENSNKDI